MTIYQVLNEENRPVYEDVSFDKARQEADALNNSFDEHYFFVEMAEITSH
jgi:hypothetical protein